MHLCVFGGVCVCVYLCMYIGVSACVLLQVKVPMDYYEDQELAFFHEVIAKETCMRKCRDKEVWHFFNL